MRGRDRRGGGGSQDDGPRRPSRIELPSACVVLPRNEPLPRAGGCQPGRRHLGLHRPLHAGARGRPALAAARTLLKPVKLRIPAGKTRRVRLQLTRTGRAQLRRRGPVAVTVVGEICTGGRVIQASRQKIAFKRRRR